MSQVFILLNNTTYQLHPFFSSLPEQPVPRYGEVLNYNLAGCLPCT
jgi:hypothetical protein